MLPTTVDEREQKRNQRSSTMKILGSSSLSPGRIESTSSTSISGENTRSTMPEVHRSRIESSSSSSRRVIENGGSRFGSNSRIPAMRT